MKISTKVRPPTKQILLLDYFCQRFTYRPREAWQALIEEGGVMHNGRLATVQTIVSAGDDLTTEFPDPDPPDANYDYTIVYEDEWILGINKPTNLRVHGRGRFIHANLIHHLRHVRQPTYPTAELANRLDANTTGVVVLTKDKETVRRMNALFRDRRVQKTYLAVVHGRPPDSGTIELPIGQLPSLEGVYRYGCGEQAMKPKEAKTEFRWLKSTDNDLSLVQLKPFTGRTHQLRVHMAELGHPLVGDILYQMDDAAFLHHHQQESDQTEPSLLSRHALHCVRNTFPHPMIADRLCQIDAPMPADLLALLGES